MKTQHIKTFPADTVEITKNDDGEIILNVNMFEWKNFREEWRP